MESVLVYQKEDYAYFADIWLFQTDAHLNAFDRNLLEFTQAQSVELSPQKAKTLIKQNNKSSSLQREFQKMESIEPLLNGYARIVYYQSYAFDRSTGGFNPLINPRKNRII